MAHLKGEEIVITGVAGCFPDAENTHELSKKLYNKIDMVSKRKYSEDIKHPEAPKHAGQINGMKKFDPQFFRVTYWQAKSFDPVGRKLLEQAFAAIFDAGINPETIRGTKLGVFIGSMQSDAGFSALYNAFTSNGFIISGCSKTMLANRISYWINGKGPSYGIDNGCAGSMSALEMAYNRMKAGEIDCAIVGGANYCFIPQLDVNMKRAGLLCLDGKTKCFDKNGDGYVRSDAINVFFLQKAKDAKRIYSEVVYVKGKYFASPNGHFSFNRNPKELISFFEEFYADIEVSPKDVEYIEANANGIADADSNELEAIGEVFGKDKSVKIGSVKSNMGNTEGASGACSVTKMCLAYQNGILPANLHYDQPQNHLRAVREGNLQVVSENEPFNRGYTAINNFCYTGGNFHTLLRGHYKPKDNQRYKCNISRLVLISGRQEENVNKIFDHLESHSLDPEHYALLNNIFKHNLPSHTGRGYSILDSTENGKTVCLFRSFEYYSGYKRPVWFLYSGMGSQWAGMGEGLLSIPVFAAAIERCDAVLKPKGLNIIKIITDRDSNSLNILHSLLAITAIQIGLTDVLKSLGLVPDNIIGHSVGELGCAYADGALTAEQTILAAYCRAIVSYETKFEKGKMAAIGLGHQEVVKLCPPDVQVACHNSFESATISGAANKVTEFVEHLSAQGIFAKEVASYDIAFHSQYIAEAGPKMLKLLKEFITEPKLRSDKWFSSCYLPEDWSKTESKYASGEYFTHNLLGSVLFEEAARLIPVDAIIVEIAPHGLLQAIMKRSHSQCINISLTRRNEESSVNFLFKAIGTLYQNGLNPDLEALYPKVEFPVSSETPLLSHLVGWDHREEWSIETNIEQQNVIASKEFIFTIHDDDYKFMKDHVRNGNNELPEAAYLVFAWETLAECEGTDMLHLKTIEFKAVKFHKTLIINPNEGLRLRVTIQKGSNRFEVTHKDKLVADGFIASQAKSIDNSANITINESENHLNQNDIYTLLSLKGYSYGKEFKNLRTLNILRDKATIAWNNNWISFLDSFIQLNALSRNYNAISTAKVITKLTVNINKHNTYRLTSKGEQYYHCAVLEDTGYTISPGVVFKDIIFKDIPKSEKLPEMLYKRQLVKNIPHHDVDIHTAIAINLQILHENMSDKVIKLKEIVTDSKSNISTKILKISEKIPQIRIELHSVSVQCEEILKKMDFNTADVFVLHNFLENREFVVSVLNRINENTYILAIENYESVAPIKTMATVTMMHTATQTLILMKKLKVIDDRNINIVSTHDIKMHDFQNQYDDKDLIFILQNERYFEKDNLMRGLIRKYKNISLYFLNAKSPKFSLSSNFYKDQSQKNLKVNIMLENGEWGTYCFVPAKTQHLNKIQNITLIATEPNNIESLTWIESPNIMNKQQIQVYYSGLSTRDCIKLSQIETNNCFGMDFSGVDSRGRRVMGVLPSGAMASTVEADSDLLWPVPQHWSLQEAATVPLPYVHALYCLAIRSYLHRNCNIFINGAAGALGQAVIAVAQGLDCTVYGTVSNADKKRFLLKLFPKLDEHNIGYTYDTTFPAMVKHRTNNERCHIVINCGSGDIRKAAMDCVGFSRSFLDTSDTDKEENETFNMFYSEEDRIYKSVNLSNIFKQCYIENKKALQNMLSEGIVKGYVRPITSVVYTPTDICRAFRLLSSKTNRGRVLINIKHAMSTQDLEAVPRIKLISSSFYIVVCDGTELSFELIDRLVQRGAKGLLIHIDPKLLNGYYHVRYSSWTKSGVRVEFNSDDIQTESSCQNIIRYVNKLGSLDGIFISYNDIMQTNNGKTIGDRNNIDIALAASKLAKASRECRSLRYFAIITATSSNASNNYALEEFEKCCLKREEQGLPSLFLRHIVHYSDSGSENTLNPMSLSTLFNAMESSLSNEYVSVLSSDLIKQNNYNAVKTNTNFDGGLEVFFRRVMEDENTASEPIIHVTTKSSLDVQNELHINPDDTFVMLVPGFEGTYEGLTSVSEGLKRPALALQFALDIEDSIPAMAKKLLGYVKTRITLKSPFHLLGYSFGINIALEIASLLEKEGLVGIIYCLDSSPDVLPAQLKAYLGNLTEEQLQNLLILHTYKLLAGHESTQLKDLLEKTTNWTKKLELFIDNVKNQVTHSHQYLKTIVQAAYNRIKLAMEYKPKYALESEIILIKGIPHPKAELFGDDYNLSKYTNKPVQVCNIETDHGSAPMDLTVSNYINRTLFM